MVLRFFLLGSVFLFMSCTDVEFNNPDDPENPSYIGNQLPSSPSAEPSSSSSRASSPNTVPSSSSSEANYGSIAYEGKTYKTVAIGEQTWMAENLNYDAAGGCGNGIVLSYANTAACDTYGRLYEWSEAMALTGTCQGDYCSSKIFAKHRGICPEGWHIPSKADLDALIAAVGGSSTAGVYLKAASGWKNCGRGSSYSYQCDDKHGFSALPGGYGPNGSFMDAGSSGRWWVASEGNSSTAYCWSLSYNRDNVAYGEDSKRYASSVRCVKDD